ncbi:hypothetical protein [Proteiniclasticum ruminis]|uniref:hypothetical protein n=1 Tax=Proteiniclasticum ruminis TaxID=398199 RepID=UPI0028A25911|nr:hypothetical protein [Proteiniclasticum ruminis]
MQHIIELLIVLLGIGMAPALYYRFPKIPAMNHYQRGVDEERYPSSFRPETKRRIFRFF